MYVVCYSHALLWPDPRLEPVSRRLAKTELFYNSSYVFMIVVSTWLCRLCFVLRVITTSILNPLLCNLIGYGIGYGPQQSTRTRTWSGLPHPSLSGRRNGTLCRGQFFQNDVISTSLVLKCTDTSTIWVYVYRPRPRLRLPASDIEVKRKTIKKKGTFQPHDCNFKN